jgi:hypothetical protein
MEDDQRRDGRMTACAIQDWTENARTSSVDAMAVAQGERC